MGVQGSPGRFRRRKDKTDFLNIYYRIHFSHSFFFQALLSFTHTKRVHCGGCPSMMYVRVCACVGQTLLSYAQGFPRGPKT